MYTVELLSKLGEPKYTNCHILLAKSLQGLRILLRGGPSKEVLLQM